MTRSKRTKNPAMDALIAELLKDADKSELFTKDGLFADLKSRIINTVLEGELDNHLGYQKHSKSSKETDNRRNGSYGKAITDEHGNDHFIEVPRDRDGSFAPQIIPKGVRRFTGFDDKVISLYARGMTVREIQGHLEEIYCTEVLPDLISTITDRVIEDAEAWQMQPLDDTYPIVYFDCIHVKARDNGVIANKAVYIESMLHVLMDCRAFLMR